MTERTGYECDICGERIPDHGWWATFKRSPLKMKLRKWGIVDISPVSGGWTNRRFDVCDDCWTHLLGALKELASDE